MGANITVLKAVNELSKTLGVNVVIHFMDNWRETLYNNSFLLLPFRLKLLSELRKLELSASKGLTISEYMASEYSKITGKHYRALMNSVDTDTDLVSSSPLEVSNTSINHFKFVYAGGLHLNRWKELLKVQESLRNVAGGICKLYIFTSKDNIEKYRNVFDEDVAFLFEAVEHKDVKRVYALADVLVHIESFDSNIVEYTKYSLSTKIPEYMLSQRPILCLAPEEIAVSKYIKLSKSGIVASTEYELAAACHLLYSDESVRLNLANSGFKFAKENHNVTVAREILNQTFY